MRKSDRHPTSRHLSLRRVLGIVAVSLVVLVAATIYGAYGYQPSEQGRSHRSTFLENAGSRYVETPLARFHYVSAGSGPPVVLLSPGATSVIGWKDQLAPLARENTVYIVDLPGQGYTELKEPGFRWDLEGMTSAIASFLDAMNLRRTALAGNSWSGGWALAFAQRHPERVTRLVLLDATGLDLASSPLWEAMEVPVLGELIAKAGTAKSVVRRQLEDMMVHDELVTDELVDDWWAPLTFHDNMHAMYRLQRGLTWAETEAAMPRTRTPTLVIWGAEDRVQPVSRADRFGELLPAARVEVLKGCGHAPQLDCPARVNALVAAFL